MSGILLPFVKFAAAENSNELVNVDNCKSVEKIHFPAPPNGPSSLERFNLLFTSIFPNGEVKKSEIKFVLEADCDAALAAFQAAAAATL